MGFRILNSPCHVPSSSSRNSLVTTMGPCLLHKASVLDSFLWYSLLCARKVLSLGIARLLCPINPPDTQTHSYSFFMSCSMAAMDGSLLAGPVSGRVLHCGLSFTMDPSWWRCCGLRFRVYPFLDCHGSPSTSLFPLLTQGVMIVGVNLQMLSIRRIGAAAVSSIMPWRLVVSLVGGALLLGSVSPSPPSSLALRWLSSSTFLLPQSWLGAKRKKILTFWCPYFLVPRGTTQGARHLSAADFWWCAGSLFGQFLLVDEEQSHEEKSEVPRPGSVCFVARRTGTGAGAEVTRSRAVTRASEWIVHR